MSRSRLLTVIFPRNRFLPEFRETSTFTIMGDNLYRQDQGFLCGPISFGDIFEARPTGEEGVVVFQRRVYRAGQKRSCFIIPHRLVDDSAFLELGQRIVNAGGFWAVDAGGVFLVFLPKTCKLEVGRELDRIMGVSPWKREFLNWKAALRWRWYKTKAWLAGEDAEQIVIRRS